uniref:Uncharacterized protein n=1 Tax=Salix viminalis TaxID=40686 RepID=A0A6N2LK09_SALVM
MILVGIFYIVSLLIPQTVDFVRCFIICNTLPRGNFAAGRDLKFISLSMTACFTFGALLLLRVWFTSLLTCTS